MGLHSQHSYFRIILLLSGSLFASTAFGQFPGVTTPPPDDLKKGWDSISIPQAKQILTFLADECDGRGSGAPGFQKAADFVAAHFKAWGLKPMGDHGTYFQNVPFNTTHFVYEGSGIEVVGSDTFIPAGPDFCITGLGASTTWTGVLAVVKPASGSIDLSDVDLKGRIVLVMADNPSNAVRSAIARQTPAVALYVTSKVPPISYTSQLAPPPAPPGTAPAPARRGGRGGARAPVLDISPQAAAKLAAGIELAPATTSQGATVQFSRGLVRIKAVVRTDHVNVPNVVALLEGSDPILKQEYIGIGGHLDHLGRRGNVVYPGADDDGSGSTAVLSIAHALVVNPKKPKRSILLMTFCGEELGLIGSGWYADHPLVPHNKMVAELQMDMVARDSYGAQNGDQRRIDVEKDNLDTIRLVGSKRISTELDKAIQSVNQCIGFRFRYDAEDVYTRSDHYNFAKHGIPIAFLFDGFTPDYHQPGDTVDKIDFLKLTNAAKLYYLTAYTVGDRTEPPKHDVAQ